MYLEFFPESFFFNDFLINKVKTHETQLISIRKHARVFSNLACRFYNALISISDRHFGL